MSAFDVIVVGTGGIGSATLLSLAERGVRVLGVDRFGPAHDRGSSHGQTRLIRQAYFEHPGYVPLLLSAYQMWHDLERRAKKQLLFPSGLLEVGPPDGIVIPGVMASAQQHDLEVERLKATALKHRFPQFSFPTKCEAVFEPTAAVLAVEACVQAQVDHALHLGAQLRFDEPVVSWSADSNGVIVKTIAGQYSAGRLVICAGAWSGQVLASVGLPLMVARKHVHWYANQDRRFRLQEGCPAFFFELPEGCFYGMPEMNPGLGVKVAEHSGGEEVLDPTNLSHEVDPRDFQRVAQFLHRHAPGVSVRTLKHSVCMYTLTPDEHFILDNHPTHPQVCFAAGLSGHGFKFSPVLGAALAELTLDGGTQHPIEFLGLSRFDQGKI